MRSTWIAIVLVITTGAIIAGIFAIGFFNPPITPTTPPKISSDDALRIVENDLRQFSSEVGLKYGVDYMLSDVAIDVPQFADYNPAYVPIDEFREKRMKLPLVYVSSNRTVLHILENGTSKYVGKCTISAFTYCGYLPPFELDYTDRLVYGAEILASLNDNGKEPLYYVVDAMNGEILDSYVVRYHMIQHGLDLSPDRTESNLGTNNQ